METPGEARARAMALSMGWDKAIQAMDKNAARGASNGGIEVVSTLSTDTRCPTTHVPTTMAMAIPGSRAMAIPGSAYGTSDVGTPSDTGSFCDRPSLGRRATLRAVLDKGGPEAHSWASERSSMRPGFVHRGSSFNPSQMAGTAPADSSGLENIREGPEMESFERFTTPACYSSGLPRSGLATLAPAVGDPRPRASTSSLGSLKNSITSTFKGPSRDSSDANPQREPEFSRWSLFGSRKQSADFKRASSRGLSTEADVLVNEGSQVKAASGLEASSATLATDGTATGGGGPDGGLRRMLHRMSVSMGPSRSNPAAGPLTE